MSEIVNIQIGQTFPPERWLEAADNLGRAFPMIARWFELQNFEGAGQGGRRGFYVGRHPCPGCPSVCGKLRGGSVPLHRYSEKGRR